MIKVIIILLLAGGIIGQEWTIHTISADGIKPSLTIDKLDRVHIAFLIEDSPGWVRYTTLAGGAPAIETVSNGYFYGPLDISCDQDNRPVIAYHDHDQEDQAVRRKEEEDWIVLDTPHPGHDGWDNAIVVSANGVIHTSSVDPSGFGGPGVEYAFYGFNGWTVEPIGSGPIMYANATSIALDPSNNPVISYFDDRAGMLKLAKRVANNWDIETVDAGPNAGRFSSLWIDENNHTYISYFVDGGFIRLASFVDNEWNIQPIDKLDHVEVSFGGARNLTSISKFGNKLGIAYGDKKAIKYATVSSAGIRLDTVSTTSNQEFGQIVSLGINSEGVAYIAFSGNNGYNNPNGNIFVAEQPMATTHQKISESRHLSTFPNPVRPGQNISFNSLKNESFKLFDLQGRLIQQGNLKNGRFTTPLAMPPGTYLVAIRSSDQSVLHSKILVLK